MFLTRSPFVEVICIFLTLFKYNLQIFYWLEILCHLICLMEEIFIFITFNILRWERIRDFQCKVSNFVDCLVFLSWVIFMPFHVPCKKDWWLMELQNYKDMTYWCFNPKWVKFDVQVQSQANQIHQKTKLVHLCIDAHTMIFFTLVPKTSPICFNTHDKGDHLHIPTMNSPKNMEQWVSKIQDLNG